MRLENYFKSTFVPAACALAALFMLNIACGDDDPQPNPVKPAEVLAYTKQTITYDDLTTIAGSNDKKAAASIIMEGVTGKKDGYTIKKVELVNSDPANIATIGTASDKPFIRLKGIAAVTFDLTLKHASKRDAVIKNCEIVIGKGKAVALTFNKLAKPYIRDGIFATADILNNVQGAKKDGYTLKEIQNISPADVATVDGKTIKIKKIGNFTADLILEHPNRADATITGAQFEIQKAGAVSLAFSKLTKVYSSGGKFTKTDIEAQLTPSSSGYALKTIGTLSPSGIATVSGTNLNFVKAGNFTAKLTFSHPTKADVVINDAGFGITKIAVNLAFSQSQLVVKQGSTSFTEPTLGGKGTSTGRVAYSINPTTGVATINASSGKLSNLTVGTATITATLTATATHKASSASYNLKVTNKTAVNLSFDKASLTHYFDRSGETIAGQKVKGANTASGAGVFTYDSTDKTVATVANDGTLTILKVGRTTITATQARTATHAEGKASYRLEVKEKPTPNLAFDPTSLAITIGTTPTEPTLNGALTVSEAGAVTYECSPLSVATIDRANGKLTIVGAGTATITATQAGSKVNKSAAASYTLVVNAKTLAIGGNPTGTSSEWGNALTPNYNVPATIADPLGGAAINAVYTYAIKTADASTGLTTADTNDSNKFDKTTGAIKANATKGAGAVTVQMTRKAVVGKYAVATKDVTLTINRRNAPVGLALAATAQEWGTAITPTLTIPNAPDGTKTYAAGDIAFAKTQVSKAGTSDVGGTIDAATGKITGTQSAGQLRITATFKQNNRYKAGGTKSVQVAVNRKASTATLATTPFQMASAAWNKATTKQMPRPSQRGSLLQMALAMQPNTEATITTDTNGIPVGERAIASDYEFNTQSDFKGATPTTIKHTHYIRSKSGGQPNKGLRLVFDISASTDGKYKAKTVVGYMRTQQHESSYIGGTPSNLKSVWGRAFKPTYNAPSNVALPSGETVTPTYTYEVTASDVGGISVGESTNFKTADGSFTDQTTDLGTVTVKIKRAAIAGKLAAVEKEVKVIFTKKKLTPAINTGFQSSIGLGAAHSPSGSGTSANPFVLTVRKGYKISDLITVPSRLTAPTTATVHWTIGGIFKGTGLLISTPGGGATVDTAFDRLTTGFSVNSISTRNLVDEVSSGAVDDGSKQTTFEFRFTFAEPTDADKYTLRSNTLSVYVKTSNQ